MTTNFAAKKSVKPRFAAGSKRRCARASRTLRNKFDARPFETYQARVITKEISTNDAALSLYFLCVLQFFVSLALIYIVTIQDSKNDGLQGQIGSTTTSSFKGKAGREEQLNLLTRRIAVAFFLIAILVAMGHK